MLLYTIVLGIPGILIFIPILLILPLAIPAFVVTLLFGQVFGIMILLWRIGKKSNISFRKILAGPFKGGKNFLRQLLLGGILATLLYLIVYSSAGLNYLGLVPSIIKIWTIPIFFVICFFIFLILNLLTQVIIQSKFTDSVKNNLKVLVLGTVFPLIYFMVYLLLIAVVMRSLYYFGTFIPISILMFTLGSGVSIISYRKTGNIITGVIINALLLTFLIVTVSNPTSGLAFISSLLGH